MANPIKLSIHSILLATDLSDNSAVPLCYAAEFASICSAKLVLVHVLDPMVAGPVDLSSELRNIADSAKADLMRVSQSLLAAKGIASDVLVRYGNVRDVVFDAQQKNSAEMVVVGSSGKKVGHGRTLGSNAEAILRSMPCHVLVIGPNVKRRSLSENVARILFPTDFSAVSLHALATAASLATKFSATLTLLHVHDPYKLENELACNQKLSQLAASTAEEFSTPVEYFMRRGTAVDEILSFAQEKDVDFIVMGAHRGDLEDGTRLHGLVSNVVRESRCPLLSVADISRPTSHPVLMN